MVASFIALAKANLHAYNSCEYAPFLETVKGYLTGSRPLPELLHSFTHIMNKKESSQYTPGEEKVVPTYELKK